jgi:GMP synthase-like glutamine amidotransferase
VTHRSKPILAVQFHPEASPGPYDCMFVFEMFKEMVLNDNIGYQRQTSENMTTSSRRGNKEKKTGGRKGVSEK